jgi:hypothetical protein
MVCDFWEDLINRKSMIYSPMIAKALTETQCGKYRQQIPPIERFANAQARI